MAVVWDINPVNSDTTRVKVRQYFVNRYDVRVRDFPGQKRIAGIMVDRRHLSA